MENPQNTKTFALVIVLVALVVAVYALYGGRVDVSDNTSKQIAQTSTSRAIVVVENTPVINGILEIPDGFPSEIPIEEESIVESARTEYPNHGATQLSASYRSAKSIAEKYEEYKNYMARAGYEITEVTDALDKTLLGEKSSTNLSVVVSDFGGGTLVELSYVLK